MLYGSEQAAVKAALKLKFPQAKPAEVVPKSLPHGAPMSASNHGDEGEGEGELRCAEGGAPPSAETAYMPNELDQSVDRSSMDSSLGSRSLGSLGGGELDSSLSGQRMVSTASGKQPSSIRRESKLLFQKAATPTRAGAGTGASPRRASALDAVFGGESDDEAAEFAAWSIARDELELKRADGDDYVGAPAVRLDLDDLGGEVCLLDWGSQGDTTDVGSAAAPNKALPIHWMNYEEVSITLHEESLHKFGKFTDRLVPLEDNPLVLPLPKSLATDMDPVATDLADIPRVVQGI